MRLTRHGISRALGIGWPLLLLPVVLLAGGGGPGDAVRDAAAVLAFGGAYAATYGACWALGAGPLRAAFLAGSGCLIGLAVLRLAMDPLAGH